MTNPPNYEETEVDQLLRRIVHYQAWGDSHPLCKPGDGWKLYTSVVDAVTCPECNRLLKLPRHLRFIPAAGHEEGSNRCGSCYHYSPKIGAGLDEPSSGKCWAKRNQSVDDIWVNSTDECKFNPSLYLPKTKTKTKTE